MMLHTMTDIGQECIQLIVHVYVICTCIAATQDSDVIAGDDRTSQEDVGSAASAAARRQWGGKPSGTVINALQNVGKYTFYKYMCTHGANATLIHTCSYFEKLDTCDEVHVRPFIMRYIVCRHRSNGHCQV